MYGCEELMMDGDGADDSTMIKMMIFLGVMFGVQSANAGVKFIAEASAQKLIKSLAIKLLAKELFMVRFRSISL